MAKWLDRAKHEIQKTPDRPAANADERTLTSALAAPQPGESGISRASNGSNGNTPAAGFLEIETVAVADSQNEETDSHPSELFTKRCREWFSLTEVMATKLHSILGPATEGTGIDPEFLLTRLGPALPAIILSGDITGEWLRGVSHGIASSLRVTCQACEHLASNHSRCLVKGITVDPREQRFCGEFAAAPIVEGIV